MKHLCARLFVIRHLSLVTCLLVNSFASLSAQTGFPALWEQTKQLEEQSLPQSALEVVDRIYREAKKEGNSPELIKSLIHKIKYETSIDRDKLPDNIREMETLARESGNKAEQSILYSLLAELYGKYYQSNLYKIGQRTALAPPLSDEEDLGDFREWPANFFIRTIARYVNLSLAPAEELQNINALDYKGILTEGETSRNLRPTLYDFLAHRGIELLKPFARDGFVPQIVRLYQDLSAFHLHKQGDRSFALLMLDLERLEFIRSNTSSGEADTAYLEALQRLKKQYAAYDFCAEIFHNEARYYAALNVPHTYSGEEKERAEKQEANMRKIYELCTEGITKYPGYERIGLLKNTLNEITQGDWEVQSANAVYPGENPKLSIHYRNVGQLTVEIYRNKAPLSIYTYHLNVRYPYLYSDTVITLPVVEPGYYEYVVYDYSSKEEPERVGFSVSRLATVAKAVNGQREFLVVDRRSGKPVEGARIQFYQRKNNRTELIESETVTTGKLGLAIANNNKDVTFYQVSSGNDTALITSPVPWISSYRPETKNARTLSLFTDRSIYRPGQTVRFKGIAYTMKANDPELISRQKYTVALHDANGKEVASNDFITNEFGSIAGEFVLPQGVLNGNFSIRSNDNARYSFRVEEYKRPSFDILFDKNETAYRLGNEVTVKGNAKTFSGVNLQTTTIRYRVTRQAHRLFRWNRQEPQQVAEGAVQTGEDGRFEIAFTAEKAFEDKNRAMTYTFTVEATITGANGETQTAQTSVHIGDKSMLLSMEGLDEVVDKDRLPTLRIKALNLSGNPVPVRGTYRIYSLKTVVNDTFDWKDDDWQPDKLIGSEHFDTGKDLDISPLKTLPSGRYRICLSPEGDAEETTVNFTLSSVNDRRPPVPVYEWLMTPKTTCAEGEKAEIIYGSSAKKVYVLYEIFQNDRKLSASRFVLNNENRKIEIPFLQSYGDGITASFTFIKDSRVFTRSVNIYRKQPDKKLHLKMEVFRDRLLPGQEEEWKISVKDGQNNPVSAEILAGMYDASLDKINRHSWYFNPEKPVRLSAPYLHNGNEFTSSFAHMEFPLENHSVPALQFDAFNWFGWHISDEMIVVFARGTRSKALFTGAASVAEVAEVAVADNALTDESLPLPEETPPVQLRQNFDETAFFYPQLKTNAEGETLLSFTVPESNTTWKLMGLAHTKDLKYGQIIEQAIAQKQLMITPNIPRFFREGDQTTIASKISNLSDKPVSGIISIECFDPATNRPAITIAGNSKDFTVEAGQTTDVSWTFDLPAGVGPTALKIVARSETFSDGEQHLIPTLPNRMQVTESLPLNIRGGQTKTFTMKENNSSTQENYRLTLEFASNPAWYAVQALPALTDPQSDHVLSWFAAFYANTWATRIAGSSPKIKQIIDVWDKETLRSNLEKNSELKAVLPEETPWLSEARDETEQKQRLALLFDINRSRYLNRQAIEKLQSFQTEEGGWAWFKGMNASVPITQWILYGLKDMEGTDNVKANAIRFIDRKFRQHFEDFKKYNSGWKTAKTISTYELEYLLVRSLYRDIPLGETEESVRFYTALTEKYRANISTLYNRAIAAIVLQRNGNTAIARSIVQSLREHATRKPDLGMFWANNTTQAFFFQSATCIHSFIMEAFRETGANPDEMDEMKLWLLKQKQTQQWESTPATVNAIRILLESGTNWLESEGKTTIQWGQEAVTQQEEAGTGYIKIVRDAPSITPDMNRVTITKEDAAPGWGALYRQYFEDLDKIASATTELNVEKSLFVEKTTPAGKALFPVAEDRPLRVGDKVVVRLTVRTDRDMEYVHLKDMRAACFEPVEQLSGIRWAQSTVYYQTASDAAMNFYFDHLPKGVYVFEYPLYVNASGNYSNGITTIQCLYAPEFVSHTTGERVVSY
ncbi:MAG: hypothetical protein LBP72_00400 [Dysgonamonadaceae bacterium]|jgi:uncharacterized protein YfaS (alpha-2-macroglobulin family)|nr:hypothetical protein [Dysgonamonadaceae bacterium]